MKGKISCACGLDYGRAGWLELPRVGVQFVPADKAGPAEAFEIRNCTCGSTLSGPVLREGSAADDLFFAWQPIRGIFDAIVGKEVTLVRGRSHAVGDVHIERVWRGVVEDVKRDFHGMVDVKIGDEWAFIFSPRGRGPDNAWADNWFGVLA